MRFPRVRDTANQIPTISGKSLGTVLVHFDLLTKFKFSCDVSWSINGRYRTTLPFPSSCRKTGCQLNTDANKPSVGMFTQGSSPAVHGNRRVWTVLNLATSNVYASILLSPVKAATDSKPHPSPHSGILRNCEHEARHHQQVPRGQIETCHLHIITLPHGSGSPKMR